MVLRNTTLSGVSLRVRNPLPAQGGAAAEPIAEAKLFAPAAFRKTLARAITADDYARLAERNAERATRGSQVGLDGQLVRSQRGH